MEKKDSNAPKVLEERLGDSTNKCAEKVLTGLGIATMGAYLVKGFADGAGIDLPGHDFTQYAVLAAPHFFGFRLGAEAFSQSENGSRLLGALSGAIRTTAYATVGYTVGAILGLGHRAL